MGRRKTRGAPDEESDRGSGSDSVSNLWLPWSTGSQVLHPHRSCRYFPFDTLQDPPQFGDHEQNVRCPLMELRTLRNFIAGVIAFMYQLIFNWTVCRLPPTVRSIFGDPFDEDKSIEDSFRYLDGIPRVVLRHTPISLLVFLFIYHFSLVGSWIPQIASFSTTQSEHGSFASTILIGFFIIIILGYLFHLGWVNKTNMWTTQAVATVKRILKGAICMVPAFALLAALLLMGVNDVFYVILETFKENTVENSGKILSLETILIVTLSIIILIEIGIDKFLVSAQRKGSTSIELVKVIVFYGMIIWMIFGTVSIVLDPSIVDPNQTSEQTGRMIASGYTLMLLFGGLLVYDGMLRTENLFIRLHEHDIVSEAEKDEYTTNFLPAFSSDLSDRTSYIFALVFAFPFSFFGALTTPDELLIPWEVSVTNEVSFQTVMLAIVNGSFVLNFFIVLVAFKFIILIKHFNRLIDTDSDLLSYKPNHKDGRGGYRELGKFATRVNIILIVGGLYVAYQAYVSFATATNQTFTLAFNVGVIIAYTIATVAWIYYSFWMTHKKMKIERERLIEQKSLDLSDAREYPVWPVTSQELFSLVSANLIPFFLLLSRYFSQTP